ncbi:MAG: glycoside hydrolase family 9 protein [Terracidiphilus sp.]
MALDPVSSCKRLCLLSFASAASVAFLLTRPAAAQEIRSSYPPVPMQPADRDGAQYRWLNKPVLSSRLLDEMEDLSGWSFKGEGEMSLSSEHVKEGRHSLKIQSTLNMGRVDGSGDWTDLVATRKFPSEDWSGFNRISLWVYPDIDGAPAISSSLVLHNEGAHILPDSTNEGRDDSIPLKNCQWNHVVWEIAPLDRDKVTALDIGYGMPKMFPDPGDKTVLYIDHLTLETVVPDHVEGWDVTPDRIAFSHSGYMTGSSKSAIASGLKAGAFSLVNASTGATLVTKPAEQRQTALGSYQVLDFTEVQKPGRYFLRAGSVTTQPFRIGDDAWRESILKALNFLYSERCGTVIPGIHGICHQDAYTTHDGRRIVVNGGYHDAGDLSATGNTPGIAYALFELAERLNRQQQDPALARRVMEEAKWGLNWVLKTSFGDGFRSTGQLISYWTNGIMGDADDRHGEAVNDPEWNFRVAAVEALAARVLKDADPELANRSLATAKQDWSFAMEGLKTASPLAEVYGQKDELERISFGAIASIDLYRSTGDISYADAAIQLAAKILASQERTLQPWSIPMTGYFYTGPSHENIFHRFHMGEEEQPIVALADLCEALPDDPHWIQWYSAIVLHAKYYQEAVAAVNAPYDVLPAAVYRESEVQFLPESKTWTPLRKADRDDYLAQMRRGIPLGDGVYLRRFPVWFDFRGNSSVLLSEAKALSVASHLRGDVQGEDLAQKQAQWIVGRNPFSSSIMYGEGYDWNPLYSVRSGQMVGAIPVGIETKGTADAPYWPAQICWTYKEVWTQPVGEWIWLMHDLSGPAVVEGVADSTSRSPVQLVDEKTGHVLAAAWEGSPGHFRAVVPQGRYTVRQGAEHTSLAVLSAGYYRTDLRKGNAVEATARVQIEGPQNLIVQLEAEGTGPHRFTLRADNLQLSEPAEQETRLEQGHKHAIIWHARIANVRTPWVGVIVQDGDVEKRIELTGMAPGH